MRPAVVEAIVGVLKGGDPENLPAGATRAEKAAAKDRYLSEFLAERGKRDRQAEATSPRSTWRSSVSCRSSSRSSERSACS